MAITLTSFAMVVAAMRAAQKDYFRTRDPYHLKLSKAYEKDIDLALDEILNPKPKQGELEL